VPRSALEEIEALLQAEQRAEAAEARAAEVGAEAGAGIRRRAGEGRVREMAKTCKLCGRPVLSGLKICDLCAMESQSCAADTPDPRDARIAELEEALRVCVDALGKLNGLVDMKWSRLHVAWEKACAVLAKGGA
jgi:hypothetical protein